MGKLSGVLLVAMMVALTSACESTPAPAVETTTTMERTAEALGTLGTQVNGGQLRSSIPSGVYIVPDEIAPGTYRFVGYMARLDDNQEVIDNDLVNNNGEGIMIVSMTDAYTVINGEADLVDEFGPIDPIALGFTEGTYLVGYDIQPGRYRITPPAEGDTAYWARLDRTMDIIDNDLGSGQLIVVVKASDWALQYTGTIAALP